MEKNNLISQFLQWISTATAVLVPISQFIFRDQFKLFFSIDEKLFTATSVVSFVLSVVVILALYSNRYFTSFKFYPNRKRKEKYYSYLQTLNTPNQTERISPKDNMVLEPFSVTLEKVAILSILLAVGWFYLFISIQNIHIISLSYILLIISIVFSASVFAIKLHLENDYKTRQRNSNQAITAKIKEYLAGDIKIKLQFNDNRNLILPIRYLTVERGNEEYKVAVNPNDPEAYFSIEKNK